MTKTVLLTGATGFVGRQVLAELAACGVRVRAVVREAKQQQLIGHPAIESVITTANLFAENSAWWAEACKGIDTALHVAWYAEPALYVRASTNLDCLTGTLEFARGAHKAGVRRFVGVGTCFEYDLSGGALSTSTALRPSSIYAATKVAAFLTLSEWLKQEQIGFAWCRLFYLYGEGEDERRLVPYLRYRLARGEPAELTSGNQIRDFLDVKEAGRLIAQTALGDMQGPVNICSGDPVTVRRLAERVADEYGRRDLLKFGVRPDNPFDPPCVFGVR